LTSEPGPKMISLRYTSRMYIKRETDTILLFYYLLSIYTYFCGIQSEDRMAKSKNQKKSIRHFEFSPIFWKRPIRHSKKGSCALRYGKGMEGTFSLPYPKNRPCFINRLLTFKSGYSTCFFVFLTTSNISAVN
jgi:hypothetical protein